MENTLRVRRAERRVTQREVAQAMGVEVTRFWAIENGHKDPTSEERAALARVLETTEDKLFPQLAAASTPTEGEATR